MPKQKIIFIGKPTKVGTRKQGVIYIPKPVADLLNFDKKYKVVLEEVKEESETTKENK